jgi:hypothetical protein
VLDVPEERETIAATKYIPREDKKQAKRTPGPSTGKKRTSAVPVIITTVIAACIVAAVLYLFVFRKPATPINGTGAASAQNKIYLNILPWAKIESIVDADNKIVNIDEKLVPCSLSLPAGDYTIIVNNSELGINSTRIEFSVGSGENTIVRNLADWEPEDLMKELKLE